MNALTILDLTEHAQHVLDLAEKQAQTKADWLHINQAAATLLNALRRIEQDLCLRRELKDSARAATAGLMATMKESCERAESFDPLRREVPA